MCFLHFFDLLKPAYIALSSVEASAQKGSNELSGELGADHLGADAEHVHVVVLDTLMGRIRVVAGRCTDPVELARRDRCANARAADEDTALGCAGQDRLADL